jgi:hypothetical protein
MISTSGHFEAGDGALPRDDLVAALLAFSFIFISAMLRRFEERFDPAGDLASPLTRPAWRPS